MSEQKTVLAMDIGGTKVAAAAVSSEGQVLFKSEAPTNLEKDVTAFLNSVSSVAKDVLQKYSDCSVAGIASAGPLDPISGELIEPTNIKSERAWGRVPLIRHLKKELGLECRLENDAACAILGESWLGKAQSFESAMILTLGTGVGVGVISNHKLLRLRQSFHPEASHFSLNFTDKLATCGCGNYGCVEAYLGGKNFTRYANQRWQLNCKNGIELTNLARSGQSAEALEAFEFYSEVMAQALCAYAVLFAPEVVIFSGGFSHAVDLFMPQAQRRLETLLEQRREGLDFMPEVVVSDFQEEIGLIGAARVALEFPERL